MAKISSYTAEVTPVTSDYMILNDASGPTTKRMLLGFLPGFVAFYMANKGLEMTKLNNPYKFRVTKSVDQTGIADATITKVTFDTEDFDTNSNFASSTYTVPIDGFYQINYKVGVKASLDTMVALVGYLYKNGSELIRHSEYPRTGFGEQSVAVASFSDILELEAGDTLEVYMSSDITSGTSTVLGGVQSHFSGFLVST